MRYETIAIPEEMRGGGVDAWGGEISNVELSENEHKTQAELARELDDAQRGRSQRIGAFIAKRLKELEEVEL